MPVKLTWDTALAVATIAASQSTGDRASERASSISKEMKARASGVSMEDIDTPEKRRKYEEELLGRKRISRKLDRRKVSAEPHELYAYRRKTGSGRNRSLSDAGKLFNQILKALDISVPGTDGKVKYEDMHQITARAWREMPEFQKMRRLLEKQRGNFRLFNDGTAKQKVINLP